MDSGNISETDIKASSVFKALQSHFSVVFAENSQQRAHLEETKRLLVASKQQNMAQVCPYVCQFTYLALFLAVHVLGSHDHKLLASSICTYLK